MLINAELTSGAAVWLDDLLKGFNCTKIKLLIKEIKQLKKGDKLKDFTTEDTTVSSVVIIFFKIICVCILRNLTSSSVVAKSNEATSLNEIQFIKIMH